MFYVYIHTCPNQKKYVGLTSNTPQRRWQNGNGYKGQMFWNAINKYGWDNIEHLIVMVCLSETVASNEEQRLIDLYNTTDRDHGYNRTTGGETGFHLSEEARRKISQANSGKNNGMYGRARTDEEKLRISEARKGYRHSAAAKRKMSEAAKKRWARNDGHQ